MATAEQNRKHQRYETDVKVAFHVPYDFRTELGFKVGPEAGPGLKYLGFSKNISVQGLCFESNKELKSGDLLWLELHLPKQKEVIYMQGEVRWCHLVEANGVTPKIFLTGVDVTKVDGADIEQTVYYDQKYKVDWSELLERVLGGFAKLNRKK
ncbi:MAG: PilZ domain-containing protein [Candidatus Omnitrophica bacterium]|nr:PilZ domain-containing protein [Candidatus Omnitrophota bacterium]